MTYMRRTELRGTTEEWETTNPVLMDGESGYEKRGNGSYAMKIGDGQRPWNELPFSFDFAGSTTAAEEAKNAAALSKQHSANVIYDNVAAMKADTKLVAGVTVRTNGYYIVNDGGAAYYRISNTEPSGYAEVLDNGKYAELISNIKYKNYNIEKITTNNIVNAMTTDVYIVTVPASERLKIGIANNQSGTLQTNVEFSAMVHADLSINAGVFKMSTTGEPVGRLIKNGVILHDETFESGMSMPASLLCIDNNGKLSTQPTSKTANELLALGFNNVVQGWYSIIENGIFVYSGSESLHARAAIGQKENGDYVLLVGSKTGKYQGGLDMRTIANLMLERNCTFAYNLDGGGSTSMTYHNIKVNLNSDSSGNERKVSTFLYFGGDDYDTPLYTAYYELAKQVQKLEKMIEDKVNTYNITHRILNSSSENAGVDLYNNFVSGEPLPERAAKIGVFGPLATRYAGIALRDSQGEFNAFKADRPSGFENGISDKNDRLAACYRSTRNITDWNNITSSGFYQCWGNQVSNAPSIITDNNKAYHIIALARYGKNIVTIIIEYNGTRAFIDSWNGTTHTTHTLFKDS